jgi:hypothetical protein
MDYISNIFQNIFSYMHFFFEKLACRTKPYKELCDNDLNDIESINLNKMER